MWEVLFLLGGLLLSCLLLSCVFASSGVCFGLIQPSPSLLAEFLKKGGSNLEISCPAAHGLLQVLRDVLHGSFALVGIAEIKRAMFIGIVRGASAPRVAASASHLDETAAKEAHGLREHLMEAAANAAFLGGERCGRSLFGHGRRRSFSQLI